KYRIKPLIIQHHIGVVGIFQDHADVLPYLDTHGAPAKTTVQPGYRPVRPSGLVEVFHAEGRDRAKPVRMSLLLNFCIMKLISYSFPGAGTVDYNIHQSEIVFHRLIDKG